MASINWDKVKQANAGGNSGFSSSGGINWGRVKAANGIFSDEDIAVTENRDMAASRTRGLGLQELNTQVQTGASQRKVPFPAMPRPAETKLSMPTFKESVPAAAQNSIARRPQSDTEIKAYSPVTPDAIKQRTKELQADFDKKMRDLDAAYKAMVSQPDNSTGGISGDLKFGKPDGSHFKDIADIQRQKLDLQMTGKATVGEAEAKRQLLAEQAKARIMLDPTNQDSWLQHAANSMSWQEANNFQLDPEYQKLAKAATYSKWKQEDAQQKQKEFNDAHFTAKKILQTVGSMGKQFVDNSKAAVQFMAGMGANTQELLSTITGIDFLGGMKSRNQNWADSSATYDQMAVDREKMVGTDERLGFIYDAAGAIPDAAILMLLAAVSGGAGSALPIIGKFMPAAKGVVTGGKVFASPLIKEGLVPLMKRTLTFAPEMIPMFAKITSQSYAANVKSGMSQEQAFIAAILNSYGQSLIEGGGMNEAFKSGGVKGLLQWAKTWAAEGSEEITQNWWENAINAIVSGKPVPLVSLDANKSAIVNVPQDVRAGAIGGVVAAGMGGAGAVIKGTAAGGVAAGQAVGKGVEAVKAKFEPTVVSRPDLFEEAQKNSKYVKDMVSHIQKSEQYTTAKKVYEAEVARVGAENTAAQQAYDAEAAKVNAANEVITKGAEAGKAEVDRQNQTAQKGYEAIVRKGLDIRNKESVSRGVNANLDELVAQVRKEQEARSANAYVAVDEAENAFDERDKTPEQIAAWRQTLGPVYNELFAAEQALEKPINRADVRNILLKGRASAELIRIASKGLIPAPAPIKGQSTAQPIPMPVKPNLKTMPTAPVKPGSAPVAPAPGEAVVSTEKMIPAIAAKLEATYSSVTPAQRAQVLALAREGVDRSGTVEKTGLSPAQVRSVLSMNGIPDMKTRAGKMWVRQQAYIDSMKTNSKNMVQDREALSKETQPTVEEQQTKLDKTGRKGLTVATDLTTGHKYVQSLAKTLGRDVVYYEGGKNTANAFYSTGAKQTLFINIDAATDAQATTVYMGHEFLHSIQQTDPKLYAELKKAFGSTLTSEQAVAALKKYEAYPEEHTKLSGDLDALIDEMMGEEAGTLFISKDFWDAVAKQNETVAQKLARQLRTFLKWVMDAIVASPNADVVGKLQLQEFQKKFEAAVAGIITKADIEAKAALDAAGMASTEDTVAPPVEQFANRTFTRDMESNDLYNALISKGILPEDAKKWLKDMTSVARTIRKNAGTLDFQGSDLYKALKSNADPQYKFSLDFSTLCVKRYVLQATLEAAQVRLGRGLSIYEWLEIRSQLKNTYKQVVSCGLCYVEAKRMFMGNAINDFYDNYVAKKQWFTVAKREGKPVKDSGQKDSKGRTIKGTKERDASTIVPYTENIPPKSLFMTQEGIDTLKRDYPEIYTDFNNLLSSNVKVKLQESRVEYDRDIAKHYKNEDTVAAQNMNSGQRIQSWSDFEAVHLLDLMQAVVDMQLVGLKAHAYTKVIDFVRSMAKTGIMINMSLIPKNMGFNEDGTLAWDNVEGIDFDKALPYAKKFDNTVGFIGVGISPAHIRAMLKDPNIHYIIPYHISGNSRLNRSFSKEATVNWTDFTPYQNESNVKSIQEEYDPDVVGSKFKFYDWWVDGDSAAVNVERYFALCKANGLNPRFSGYTNRGIYDPDFDFRKDPNYYKMLGDRRLFNNKGEAITQQIVRPEFDNKVNQEILADYIANPTPNAAHQQTVDKFLSDIEAGVEFAPSEEDIAELEKQWAKVKKAEAKAKKLAREAAAAPKIHYSMVPFKGSDKPIFYSQMERVINDMKQNKWQASAVLPYLKANRGIKPEEIRWSGIESWLKTFDGPVTKAELLEFARASDLGIQTIFKGEGFNKEQWSFDYARYDTEEAAQKAYEKEKKILEDGYYSVQSTALLLEADEEDYQSQYQYEVMDINDEILFGIKKVTDRGETHWETSQEDKEYEDMAAVRADLPRLVKEINEGKLAELEPPELVTWEDYDTTKFRQYSYTDATNYREVLFTLPPSVGNQGYSSPHWYEMNVLAHARLNDRKGKKGEKVLFIEEIQSDMHQQGRKKGYNQPAAKEAARNALKEAQNAALAVARKYDSFGLAGPHSALGRIEDYGVESLRGWDDIVSDEDKFTIRAFVGARGAFDSLEEDGVPEAPFAKTWPMYVFKRILRMAAEGGYDKIAWSTSNQQFDRWGSERFDWKKAGTNWKVSGIEQVGGHAGGVDLEQLAREKYAELDAYGHVIRNRGELRHLIERVMSRTREEYSPSNWVKHIDSLTDKMWNRMQVEDEGNMMPRKEGMEGFYDRMLNKDVENYLKPFGTEVRLEGYPSMDSRDQYVRPAVSVLPDSFGVEYGEPDETGHQIRLDRSRMNWIVFDDVASAYDSTGNFSPVNMKKKVYTTEKAAMAEAERLRSGKFKSWTVDLNPAINDMALSGEQTQYSVRPHIFNYGTQKPPVDMGAAWSKTYSEVVDSTFRISQADKEAGRLALNSKLVSGSVDYILKHGMVNLNGEPIGASLKSVTDKMTPADWDYLAYRHNIDRYMEGKPVIPGADVAASRQYVAAAEARDPGTKTRADAVVKWIDDFMQEWGVNSGLIDATTYADWRNMYPSYFPTYREFSDLEAGNTGTGAPGRHFIDLPNPVKGATGSDRELTHPVGNIMQMVNKMVRSARYNEVGVAMMNAVRANPRGMAKYAEEVPPRLGMFSRDKSIVSVWDGGTPRYMQVNDEALLDTLNGLPKVINNAKIMRKFNRAFKSLITTDNPFFAIRNMFRDIPTAYVYGSQWFPPSFFWNLLKADFNLMFNTAAARQYKGLGGAGGGQFNTGLLDIPRKGGTNAFEAGELAKTMKTNPLKYVNPFHYIKMFNEIIEQAPRLSEFDYVLRKTGDVQKALRAAQEVTVDFSRGGNISKSIDAYVPFFNASVQGIDTFNRKMLDVTHPVQMASRWIKAAIMVTVPSVVSMLMCTGNDRDRKAYENVSQFVKDSSYLFPKGDGTFWRIPKSRELGVLFASLFERLFTNAVVPGLEAKGMDTSFLNTVWSNFLPVNPLASNLASPLVVNLPMNKKFGGGSIVPANLTKYSAGLQYDENTSSLAKAIGQLTYDVSGSGVSPKQIDYIMDAYLGMLADFALPAMTPRSGAGNAFNRMSVGAYTTDPAFSSQRVEDFYNRATKLENLSNDPNRLNNIPSSVKTPEEKTYTAYNALLTVASSASKYINSSLKADDPKVQQIRNVNNEWMAKAVKAKEAWELKQIKTQWEAALYQLGVVQ